MNITLALDDDLVRRARAKALERGTSLNAVLREFLEDYAGESSVGRTLTELFALADASPFSMGEEGITWTREDLHDRAKLR
jgi:hypothetical protein